MDEEPLVAENCLDYDNDDDLHDDYTTTYYSFAPADTRLACAFKGIIGSGGYYNVGNFNEFITTRHKDAMDDLSAELSFGESETHPKESWVTEWNIKNNSSYDDTDLDGENKETRRDVYNNTFVHAYLIQEQFINMMQFNNIKNELFRENYNTVATLQNYLGGSSIQLVTKAQNQDMVALGLSLSCSGIGFKNYVPRTLYHSYKLLNQIHLNNLHYVKTNKTKYSSNLNQPPTVFITPNPEITLERGVYVYFTNVKAADQTYIIKPGTLVPVSLTGTNAEIHCIDAQQLYSNSGSAGTLYDINTAYASCVAPAPANFYEIQGERAAYIDYETCPTDMPSGAMCVTVPAYSLGYFIFSYNPYLKEGAVVDRFQIFPNPTSTNFTIQQTDYTLDEMAGLEVEVYTLFGQLISKLTVDEGGRIDISNFPVGVYSVIIRTENGVIEFESVVKMK